MDSNLRDMSKAYAVVRQAMLHCGWHHLYHKVTLSSGDVYEILYYSNLDNKRDFPLCIMIKGILFDQIPELHQVLNQHSRSHK